MPLAAAIALTVVPNWREIAQRVSPEATVWVAACAPGMSSPKAVVAAMMAPEARTVRECLDKDDLQWIGATHDLVRAGPDEPVRSLSVTRD